MNQIPLVCAKPGEVIGKPIGLPIGRPNIYYTDTARQAVEAPEIPGEGLPRAINYLADYGGCSFYRCMAPNMLLNLKSKAVIIESTVMHLDPNIYRENKVVKVQRQATPHQKEFMKFLRKMCDDNGGKLIYEIDDVTLAEDIPMYNKNREAFVDPVIRQNIIEMMDMCDEITVTCEYMRDYFKSKLTNQNITVIPNYLMKWWFDRYFDIEKLKTNYEKNKRRSVISIFASGTHVDVAGRNNFIDDFEKVWPVIAKTKKQFKWQFYGSYPYQLKPLVDSGEIIFKPWVDLPDFADAIAKSGTQLCFAALQDNNFNRSKSNIKLVESGAIGLPCVCPDMVTYKDAILKYKTGDEFIDVIKSALKDNVSYSRLCRASRAYAEKFWLDDEENLMKHHEAYFTPFGSKDRKYIKS